MGGEGDVSNNDACVVHWIKPNLVLQPLKLTPLPSAGPANLDKPLMVTKAEHTQVHNL